MMGAGFTDGPQPTDPGHVGRPGWTDEGPPAAPWAHGAPASGGVPPHSGYHSAPTAWAQYDGSGHRFMSHGGNGYHHPAPPRPRPVGPLAPTFDSGPVSGGWYFVPDQGPVGEGHAAGAGHRTYHYSGPGLQLGAPPMQATATASGSASGGGYFGHGPGAAPHPTGTTWAPGPHSGMQTGSGGGGRGAVGPGPFVGSEGFGSMGPWHSWPQQHQLQVLPNPASQAATTSGLGEPGRGLQAEVAGCSPESQGHQAATGAVVRRRVGPGGPSPGVTVPASSTGSNRGRKRRAPTSATPSEPRKGPGRPGAAARDAPSGSDDASEGRDDSGSDGQDAGQSIKRHTCSFCSYAAKTAWEIRVHERTHTGEKPYKCSYCDYRAAQQGNMRIHERRHTGDRPFLCPYCSFSSSTSVCTLSHVVLHHPSMPLELRGLPVPEEGTPATTATAAASSGSGSGAGGPSSGRI